MADYSEELLAKAIKDYPFIAKHNPMVIVNPAENRGYAETYPIGETGAPLPNGGYSKHSSLPIDRIGVEVFRPKDFTHHDLAAEMLHIDPMANQTREAIIKTWTPEQLKTLKEHALDYQATLDEGRPETDAIQNATDSALRGYTVNQWPENVNKALAYNPEQLKALDLLKSYMIAPLSRKELIQQQIDKIE
jgi:hypothetical protein